MFLTIDCRLPFSREHLSFGACLEDKREDNQHYSVLTLCCVVHDDMHTHVSSSYIFIRLKAGLQPNIGFTLWHVLAVFMHSAIILLKLNRFG